MTNFMWKVLLLVGFFEICAGAEYIIDTESDVNPEIWKIWGNSTYLESGAQLRRATVKQFLPENFNYSHFDTAVGIWAVFPAENGECAASDDSFSWARFFNSDRSHEGQSTHPTTVSSTKPHCDASASASFQCTFESYTIVAVNVSYIFGGNALVRIAGERSLEPVEMEANYVLPADWEHSMIWFHRDSWLLLEAVVKATGDFILIDKIAVQTLEPPTSQDTLSKVPETTTTTPFTPSKVISPGPRATTQGPSIGSGESVYMAHFSPLIMLGVSFFIKIFGSGIYLV